MFTSNTNQSTACQNESRQELVCMPINGKRKEFNSSSDFFSHFELPLIIYQTKILQKITI